MSEVRLNIRLIASLKTAKFMSAGDMIELTIKNKSTWYRLMDSPGNITVQQLLAIANGLHIPVRRFFLTDDKEPAMKRCDDCIVSDYKPCDYDADALRRLVEKRRDTTWQKAADATGLARDNLKNSLLAVRRTPVARFLESCKALKIDPFTILHDPNPKQKGRRAQSNHTGSELHAEVKLLRRDVESLNLTVEDLKLKYDGLLRDYEQLAKRLQVNIGTINDSHIGTIGISPEPIKK